VSVVEEDAMTRIDDIKAKRCTHCTDGRVHHDNSPPDGDYCWKCEGTGGLDADTLYLLAEIERLRSPAPWQGHNCGDTTRAYPAVLCSLCDGKAESFRLDERLEEMKAQIATERTTTVAYLRARATRAHRNWTDEVADVAAVELRDGADAIERGDHRKAT
jgi:hypothetical protein